MFGAEPIEPWSEAEQAEFEEHVAARTRAMLRQAGWATAGFGATLLLIVPFLAGHPLNRYWDRGAKNLVWLAYVALLWVVMRWGSVWSSWQSARETRREMEGLW